jgi:hypothetical protein
VTNLLAELHQARSAEETHTELWQGQSLNWLAIEVMSPLRYIRTMLLRWSSHPDAVSDESI